MTWNGLYFWITCVYSPVFWWWWCTRARTFTEQPALRIWPVRNLFWPMSPTACGSPSTTAFPGCRYPCLSSYPPIYWCRWRRNRRCGNSIAGVSSRFCRLSLYSWFYIALCLCFGGRLTGRLPWRIYPGYSWIFPHWRGIYGSCTLCSACISLFR